MKIAIFVDQFPVRSHTFILNQITGLIDLGVDVQIIALYQGDITLFEQGDYLSYQLAGRCCFLLERQSSAIKKLSYRFVKVALGLFKRKTSLKVFKGLNPILGRQSSNLLLASIAANHNESFKFDWIICHFGPNGVIGNKLRKIGVFDAKLATVFHGFDISIDKKLNKTLKDYQLMFNEAELMLPISDLWRNKLIDLGCSPNKIVVHRMGVNLDDFPFHGSVQGNSKEPTLKICSIARFTEKKGLKYAIESLIDLPDTIKVDYQLGGYGDEEQTLRNLVKKHDLADKVTFCGSLSVKEVREHILSADVFLQPSITACNGDMEGVPVAIMEAMALGTPVVSTYHSGIPELIEQKKSGLLVAERNAKAIAEMLEHVYQLDNEQKSVMVTQARERIESMANISTLNQQLLNLLKIR